MKQLLSCDDGGKLRHTNKILKSELDALLSYFF